MASAAYVTQQYQELLGRAPDAGGLAHYSGYSNPAEVRSSIIGSAEYKQRQGAQAAPAAAPAAPDPWEGRVNSLYGEVGTFDKNAKNPLDIYNQTLEKLGIGDARTRVTSLREQILNTENLLRNVAGDVQARTQDALVSENQRRRLTAMEEQPLAQQAGIIGRNLEMADANYKDILGEGKAQTEMQYNFQKDQRAALMDRLKIAIDGAKTAEDKRRWQAEYNRLVEKDKQEAARWQQEFALKQQQAAAAARGGGGGGGGGGGSSGGGGGGSAAGYNTARNETIGFLDKYKGGDGYVSPKTFADARRAWTAKGQDPAMFSSLFGGWANPSHIKDYS